MADVTDPLSSARALADQEAKDIRYYVVTHIPGQLDQSLPGYTPIYVGPAAASAPPGSLTDVLQGQPSLPNERWSELSAIYRIWKAGPKSDVVGFCHYRRFLNFTNPGHQHPVNHISPDEFQALTPSLYDEALIRSVDDGHSILGADRPLPQDVYSHYADCHSASDYLDAFKIVGLRHPHIVKYLSRQFERRSLYACNLFILSWANFDELCRFMFDVLQEFCRGVEWPRGDAYVNRDVSFLSERLFDAWIRMKQDAGHKLTHRPVLWVVT